MVHGWNGTVHDKEDLMSMILLCSYFSFHIGLLGYYTLREKTLTIHLVVKYDIFAIKVILLIYILKMFLVELIYILKKFRVVCTIYLKYMHMYM
jgi:hypothetical protein